MQQQRKPTGNMGCERHLNRQAWQRQPRANRDAKAHLQPLHGGGRGHSGGSHGAEAGPGLLHHPAAAVHRWRQHDAVGGAHQRNVVLTATSLLVRHHVLALASEGDEDGMDDLAGLRPSPEWTTRDDDA